MHTVETAENVPIRIELAGLSSRVFAFMVDLLIMMTLMLCWFMLLALPTPLSLVPDLGKTLTYLAIFLITFGYHMFQEWLWNGRTVGKSLLGIRVVRNNGQAIGFWESLGRNLMRVLDILFSGIGLLCMLCNKSEKRFGDYVAGTVVISDQPGSKPAKVKKPVTTPAEPADTMESRPDAPTHALSAEETELLKNFQKRRNALFPEARRQMTEALCRYFSERLHTEITTESALDQLLV